MNSIPEWFWRVIEQTKPNKEAFNKWLEAAEKERIVQFYLAFDYVSMEISDYSDGVKIDDYVLSEDGMEDFCDWIVSQGKDFWSKAIEPYADLVSMAKTYLQVESGEITEYPDWGPQQMAVKYFYKKFNESIYEAAGELDDEFYDAGENWLKDETEQN